MTEPTWREVARSDLDLTLKCPACGADALIEAARVSSYFSHMRCSNCLRIAPVPQESFINHPAWRFKSTRRGPRQTDAPRRRTPPTEGGT